MVVFNDPVPIENPALQAVLMALELRNALGALTQTWSRLGHEIGFGIGIAHGFATLGTIGYEGRFDYAAIETVSNVASRLCDEAKPGQILISARVLMKVANAAKVEPVGEFRIEGDQEAPGRLQRARHGLVRGLRGLTQPSCQVLGRLQLRNRLSFWSHDINCKRESLSKGGSRCDSARGRDYLQISTR